MVCGSARDLNLRPRRSKATHITTIPQRLLLTTIILKMITNLTIIYFNPISHFCSFIFGCQDGKIHFFQFFGGLLPYLRYFSRGFRGDVKVKTSPSAVYWEGEPLARHFDESSSYRIRRFSPSTIQTVLHERGIFIRSVSHNSIEAMLSMFYID